MKKSLNLAKNEKRYTMSDRGYTIRLPYLSVSVRLDTRRDYVSVNTDEFSNKNEM